MAQLGIELVTLEDDRAVLRLPFAEHVVTISVTPAGSDGVIAKGQVTYRFG